VKDQELNPRPHTPRPAALPVKVEQWVMLFDKWARNLSHVLVNADVFGHLLCV